MAGSSTSHQQNQELNSFFGIEPAGIRRKVSESLKVYDVFINHRGPDVKQTLAIQLYDCLEQSGIRVFLDSEEMELGNSFPSIIETAIRSAYVHIAIFSRGYAESPWCLAELVLMLESKAKIIPVFYLVEPWELRHIEKGVYADAFIKYEEKGRYLGNLKQWKEALQSLSFIAGEEFNSFNDWGCQNIVEAIKKEVQSKRCLHVATYPVGLNNLVEDFERHCIEELVEDFERHCIEELVEDFERHCRLKKGNDKGKVVGIFGMGGSGKTTLAKELFNRKISNYSKVSFLFDVREASVKRELPSLQLKLLKDLFGEKYPNFTSLEEGTSYLKDNLRRSPNLSFLIVVDDIDHVEQLNALRVMDILNKSGDSLVIVTTRDTGVLITAGITAAYHLKGMDSDKGRELFCWHAFGEPNPSSGYDKLVNSFVDLCGGLPLSLQVLGRHVHGRSEDYWRSELIKVRKTLPQDVKQRLRISFDALDAEEKQVFMDIACFFVGKPKSIAERVWEGSGWNGQHALQTLKDKCLIEKIENIELRMHDHLRDLGREMALEFSPPRLWRPQDLKALELMGFKNILAKTNVRCFHSIFDESVGSQVTYFLGQSDNCVETSASLLWLQLEGNSEEQPSIPSWIPLQNLLCLQIHRGQLKTLWGNSIQAPSHLKELLIFQTSLKEFPDLLGVSDNLENMLENGGNSSSAEVRMSGLEKLEISGDFFLSKILISGFHYPSLESIKLHGMKNLMAVNLARVNKLNCLDITNCEKLKRLTGTSDLTNLVLLNISQCPEFVYLCLGGMKCLETITFDRNVKVKYFELNGCQNLKTIHFGYEKLVKLSIRDCPELVQLSGFRGSSCLERIIIDGCGKLNCLQLDGCQNLESVSGNFELRQLYISDCPKLERLPSFTRVEQIEIYSCEKLQNIMLPATLIRVSLLRCRELKRVPGIGDLMKLTELIISECPELEEFSSLSRLSCLEEIEIDSCEKLQNITLPTTLISLTLTCCRELQGMVGIGDLTKLARLIVKKCPELEELPSLSRLSCLEQIEIDSCEKLKNITLPTTLGVPGMGYFTKLRELLISECPELEELPNFSTLSCLEKIEIKHCEKINNIMLPTTLICLSVRSCRDLQRVEGTGDLTNLTKLYINECPKLEELPSLASLSCLKWVVIESCEKVENVAGIEELHALKSMKLFYCSNAAIRNCIPKLKCVPSDYTLVIGRAADGAESALNEHLFSDAHIGADAVTEIGTHKTSLEEMSVIGCAVVVVESSTLIEDINKSLSHCPLHYGNGVEVRQGEWIITMVACDYWSYRYYVQMEDVYRRYGIVKKGYRVEVKEGEDWKIVHVLRRIVDRLHHS